MKSEVDSPSIPRGITLLRKLFASSRVRWDSKLLSSVKLVAFLQTVLSAEVKAIPIVITILWLTAFHLHPYCQSFAPFTETCYVSGP